MTAEVGSWQVLSTTMHNHLKNSLSWYTTTWWTFRFFLLSVWGRGNRRRRPTRWPGGGVGFIENKGMGGGLSEKEAGEGRGDRMSAGGGGLTFFLGSEIATKTITHGSWYGAYEGRAEKWANQDDTVTLRWRDDPMKQERLHMEEVPE